MKRRSKVSDAGAKAQRPSTMKLKDRSALKQPTRRAPSAIDGQQEIAWLTRELNEAVGREAATSDVLQVISRSSGELEPVFAAMECGSHLRCHVWQYLPRWDGEALHLLAAHNTPPAFAEARKRSSADFRRA
jgi:hypothetical protein